MKEEIFRVSILIKGVREEKRACLLVKSAWIKIEGIRTL